MNAIRRSFSYWPAIVLAFSCSQSPAVDQAASSPTCSHLYSDSEARGLERPAENAVPGGEFRRKPEVLKALSIDVHRLCNRRFQGFNLTLEEVWQISPNYDLVWWAVGPDRYPMESDMALIHAVQIVQHPAALELPR